MSNKNDNKESLHGCVYKRYWKIFQRDTATVSSTCRQLALGIGSVLIISKIDTIQQHHLLFTIIIVLIVLFFSLDASQYHNSSLRFKSLAQRYNDEIDKGCITNISELEEKKNMNLLTNFLFSLKIITLIIISFLFLILLIIPFC